MDGGRDGCYLFMSLGEGGGEGEGGGGGGGGEGGLLSLETLVGRARRARVGRFAVK